MDLNNINWMNYSIDVSKETPQSHLHVGAVVVSDDNQLLYSSCGEEDNNESWFSIIINKAIKRKIFKAQSVYLTINTWSEVRSFDLIKLLKVVHINEIYIGLPDPTLVSYFDNDPVITRNHVYRYPDQLKRQILDQNIHFFSKSKQNINHSPYYSKNSISNLVIENLKSQGFFLLENEIRANKSHSLLTHLICKKYKVNHKKATDIVNNALSAAFNIKYKAYDYSNDLRSLDTAWKKNFMSCYRKLSTKPLCANSVTNVGVASGNEAKSLFSSCKNITFVDIADDGLKRVKDQIPLSKVIVSSAADLSLIPDNSQDLYIALRTYNSSFFEIKKAVSEAIRVLKHDAMIIVSIANGFLYLENSCIIPGLILPGTKFVDIYRGIDTAKIVQAELIQAGFKSIRLYSTNTEIYLSAKVTTTG
ncbi:MAG: methyltransferase domain-containing protein [Pseudomonadota bacterium]